MSRLPFELFLALRYLRPKRTFVSVITLISVVGVMLGVAVLIIVISVMTGFDRQLRDKILGFSAHIKIFRYEQEPLADYEALEQLVRTKTHVRAVAPFILGQVMMKTQLIKNENVPSCGLAKGNPERLLQWMVSGLKKGRIVSTVRGTIERMPNSVAKPAPSRMPK